MPIPKTQPQSKHRLFGYVRCLDGFNYKITEDGHCSRCGVKPIFEGDERDEDKKEEGSTGDQGSSSGAGATNNI